MANVRKFTSCTRYFSRAFSHYENKKAPITYAQMYFNRCVRYIPKHDFTVEASLKASQLETVLQTGAFEDVMGSTNKETDVYLFGMPLMSTKEEIGNFFGELDIEEIIEIDTSRSPIKKFFYVRFTNEESKKKALEKNKEYIGSRYVEINGIEDVKILGKSLLHMKTSLVLLNNLPFGIEKDKIIEWMKPTNVNAEDIVFIQKSQCVVELHDENTVVSALEKNADDNRLDGRKVSIKTFLGRELAGKLQKYVK